MTTTTSADAQYKGTAVYVAEFLSTFQGFFRRNDAERKGPISVEMMERALEFRQRLCEHYSLDNKLALLQKDDIASDQQLKRLEEALEASKSTIESTPASIRAVHELLRRFEVWSTKSLANQVLTYCVKDDNDKVTICCSPLLNMPGASYFLPPDTSKPHVCGMSVPANAWMWQELLRMCSMVSLLEDPQKAMKSTLTAASPSLIGQHRKEELKLSFDHELTPADLVALWVRAQRNTSGLVHFLHLFKVTEAPQEPRKERYSIKANAASRGKMLVVDNDDDDESDVEEELEPRYIAKFVGNHKKTRRRVRNCSSLVDKLVEWAVMNQALFTYKYIREFMPERLGLKKSGKKRPRSSDDDSAEESSQKRRKSISKEDEAKLLQACRCYVLRWFGRRNRKVVSILYSSKLKVVDLFPYESLVEQLESRKVPNKVKKLVKNAGGDTNRTLARVDRRVRLGTFDVEGNEGDCPSKTFREIVVTLLKALAKRIPAEIIPEAEVLAACNDFERLYDRFLLDKSAAEAAELLLDDFGSKEAPVDLLLSFTEPWEDHCAACSQALDEKDEIVICDSCGKTLHSKCAGDNNGHDARKLMKEYCPLEQLNAAFPDELKPKDVDFLEVCLCSTCQKAPITRSKENRIYTEAMWCKALIRVIGMESYALPFHDERADDDNQKGRHVSLRRLDSMMDFIALTNDPSLTEDSRQKRLNAMRSPFLLPPSAGSPSPEPIEWVTESMQQNPVELLCKGVELMILPPSDPTSDTWKNDRTAFFRRFVPLFTAWFICTRKEGFPLQPSGTLSHALVARVPWSQDSCLVCRARPAGASEAASPVCEDEACQHLHSSGNLNGKDDGMVVESLEAPSAAEACYNYDELSSLVGSPLLILPGDQMLQFVSEDLKTSIDHMDRPMIFIVISYLPPQFGTSDKHAGQLDEEGIFHVVPVIYDELLKYFLSELKMRCTPDSYIESDDWTSVKAFDFEGVVRMAADELRLKLRETTAIRKAMDSALEEILHTAAGDRAPRPNNSLVNNVARGGLSDLVGSYSSLIDCLLRSQNPLVRDMIGSLRPASREEESDNGFDVLDVEHITDDFQDKADDTMGSTQQEDSSDSGLQQLHASHAEARTAETLDAPSIQETEPLPLGAPLQAPGNVPMTQKAAPVTQAFTPLGPHFVNRNVAAQTTRAPSNHVTHQRQVASPGQPFSRRSLASSAPPFNQQAGYYRASANIDYQSPVERVISKDDLYLPGFGFWTRIETAVYLEACRRSLPQLGLRLLCPRYSLNLTREQLPKLFGRDLSRIPKVQESLWEDIVFSDYKRTETETGEIVLQDRTENGVYGYRVPTQALPLDRIAESFLRQREADVVDLTSNEGTVNRIRGGGPSDEGLFEVQPDPEDQNDQMQVDDDQGEGVNGNEEADEQPEIVNEPTSLIDTPRSEWQGKVVYVNVVTTVHGQDRTEAMSMGVVQDPGQMSDDNDGIPVSLFYFSNAGYLDNGATHVLPASQLRIVEDGSNEHRIAQQWEGFARLPLPRRVSPDGQIEVDDALHVNDDVAETDMVEIPEEASSPLQPASPPKPQENKENVDGEAGDRRRDSGSENRSEPFLSSTVENGDRSDIETNKSGTEAPVLLETTPKDSWINRLVFSNCQTTDGGDDVEDAKMIGVVQSIVETDKHDDTVGEDLINVSLIYFSNEGHLPEAAVQTLSASSFYVVQEGSDEDKLARQWKGIDKLMNATHQTNHSGQVDENLSARETVEEVRHSWSTSMNAAGKLLVSQLCQRQQGPAPIGQLPDGRAVLWVQSDPRALYIRSQEESAAVDHRQGCLLSCPWGCHTREGDNLNFDSVVALHDHLQARHGFGQLDDSNVVDVAEAGRMFRIPEGQIVVTLSSQLASAICFEEPKASAFFRGNRLNAQESLLDLSHNGHGSPKESVLSTFHSNDRAQSLLRLWSKVARLFAVESTGLFRMALEDCETLLHVGNQDVPSRAVTESVEAAECAGCLMVEKNASMANNSSNCGLCGLRFDSAVRLTEVAMNDDEMAAVKAGGAGCCLLSALCKASDVDVKRSSLRGDRGPEGVARTMLIRIAEIVPKELRRLPVGTSTADSPIVWDCGNYQSWRYLVERSHTVESFLQAFVVLVHSLHTSKLPGWWTRTREGWTSAFASMASAPYGYPALFMRLYALDLAIAEFLLPSRASLEDTAPQVLQRMSSVEERMHLVHEWAKRIGYSRFEGEHESECAICKDGGHLLMCEYCKTTQHPSCCVPKIVDDSKLHEDWVCPKCVTDLDALKDLS